MRIQTKYGDISIKEDELGGVSVTFNADNPVVIEMRASNALTFHTIGYRSNVVVTMRDTKYYDEKKRLWDEKECHKETNK